jgi:ABC-type molybdate transport system substrate-binding protein
LKLPRRNFLHLAAGAAALAILLLQDLAADAAEIKVLSTNAITSVTDELYGQFERATGNKLTVRYEFGPVLNREIASGGTVFDVAILSLDVAGLVRQGKIVEGTRTVLGRTGIGVGVRKGAVGWLPAELQSYVIFTGGVSATAKEPETARTLLNFMTTPEAAATLKVKGLEPVKP